MEAVAAKPILCSILVFFSWSHSNIGDIGITPGMIRLLEQNVPGVELTICANSRADATREYLTSRFPNCKVVATPFRGTKLTPEFREAFDRADLILYNSGTTLSYGRWERNWDRTMPLAMPLVMAREAGKPYGIYCQSFERFQWPSDVMFRPLLSDAAFVFVRDGNSLEYLRSLGIKPPIMEYGPDATFAFDLRDEAAADKFMRRHNLQPRKFITLTIRTSCQGFIDEKREQVHAAKMRQLVETWVMRTGLDVLICPEVKHEIEPARRLIYDPLPADVRKHVRIKEDFWLPDEAFSVYARAHTIVSMEMHSIILGLAAGTPILHPRFVEAGRKAWMLRDLGIEEWLFDLDNDPANEITASLLKIHDDYDAALVKVNKAMDFVHKRQKETMELVKRTAIEARKDRPRPTPDK